MPNYHISLLSKEFFNFIKNQHFSIPVTIIQYIFDNATSNQWQKLQKLCKLFFLQHRYLIIQNLNLLSNTNSVSFGKDSLKISGTSPIFLYLQNIWISGTFKAHTNGIHCSRLISKIIRCDIHTLNVCHNLDEKDFDILNASENIQILVIYGIIDEKGAHLPIENIYSKIPQAHSIEIHRSHVTKKTMKILLGINHKVKLQAFLLRKIDGSISVNDFYDFIKINAAKNANFWIDFSDDDAHNHGSKKFRAMISKKLKLWQPEAEKPIFRKTSLF